MNRFPIFIIIIIGAIDGNMVTHKSKGRRAYRCLYLNLLPIVRTTYSSQPSADACGFAIASQSLTFLLSTVSLPALTTCRWSDINVVTPLLTRYSMVA